MEFPTGKKGMDFIPENLRSSDGMLRKSFRRKVKRLADREERLVMFSFKPRVGTT